MKSFIKCAAVAVAASLAFGATAFAASDDADLSTASGQCKAEITAATGTPADKIRSGAFNIKAKTVVVRMSLWTEGKSKTVACTLDRKSQKLSDIKWPEGVSPVAAAAAPAAEVATTAPAAPTAQ